jgi:hypothetical protein
LLYGRFPDRYLPRSRVKDRAAVTLADLSPTFLRRGECSRALGVPPYLDRRGSCSRTDLRSSQVAKALLIRLHARAANSAAGNPGALAWFDVGYLAERIGSPATATRSANFPGSTAPTRACQPSNSAAFVVTAEPADEPAAAASGTSPAVISGKDFRHLRDSSLDRTFFEGSEPEEQARLSGLHSVSRKRRDIQSRGP